VAEGISVLNAALAIGAAHSIVFGRTVYPFSTETSAKCCAESRASTLPFTDPPSKTSTNKLVACHGRTNTAALPSTSCCKSQHSCVASFCEPRET